MKNNKKKKKSIQRIRTRNDLLRSELHEHSASSYLESLQGFSVKTKPPSEVRHRLSDHVFANVD